MTAFVVLNKVSKVYRQAKKENLVLNELNLHLEQGEFLAIKGSSGSGKTSLLRLIAGIDLPSSGSITVANYHLDHLSEAVRARFRQENIGFAFQFFDLLDELNLLENIALPALIAGQDAKLANKKAEAWLERFDLKNLKHAFPQDVSGGEMQRVSLARAMINEPSLILADEPTSHLDSLDSELSLGLLSDLRRELGLTIILVTHDAKVAAYADKVMNLRSGQFVFNMQGAGID